ncbi:PH domain-containing protein [Haloterrigena turkmenica]
MFVLIVCIGAPNILLRYRSWRFDIDDRGVTIEYGVIRKRHTFVPMDRIQHVDTNQTLLDRLFGLSRVVIHTASAFESDLTIPGLCPEQTIKIRNKIFAKQSSDGDVV